MTVVDVGELSRSLATGKITEIVANTEIITYIMQGAYDRDLNICGSVHHA